MSESLTYLRTVGDYWTRLGAKTLFRIQHALDDVENEAYTFQKLTLDVLGFYNDSFSICMNAGGAAADGSAMTGPMSTVQITAPQGQDAATGKVATSLPPGTALTSSDLLYVPTGTQTAKKIDQSNVTPTVTAGGDLKVDLKGLAAAAVVGSYRGLVLMGGAPVADILLQIT